MIKKFKKFLDLIAFSLPALLSVLLVSGIPFVMNIYYSFYKWNGISQDLTFVGLDNFIKIFTDDPKFFTSFMFTIKFSIVYVVFINVLAILIANWLSNSKMLSRISRSLYFLPHIISLVAISLIWKFLLGPGFDYIYELTNISFFGKSWLGDPSNVFYTIVFISIWQNVGFYMIIYIAGFMALPNDIMEAASIDGASDMKKFFKMKLPLLMPSITICTFHALTYGFKLFDIILVLTRGGPGNASTSVAYDIFKEAFLNNRYGMATAKSLVFFVVVLLVTVIQLGFFKKKEVEL